MSEPIKPGDLVMVVRNEHACIDIHLGKIGVVASLTPSSQWWFCPYCGKRSVVFERGAFFESGNGMPLSWLKKIDPPAEAEHVEHSTQSPVRVPA